MEDEEHDAYTETYNALRYLKELLEYRDLQHKKQQIKKRIIARLAREQGWMDEINAAAEIALQKHVANSPPGEAEEFGGQEDVEDDTEGDLDEDFEQEETK